MIEAIWRLQWFEQAQGWVPDLESSDAFTGLDPLYMWALETEPTASHFTTYAHAIRDRIILAQWGKIAGG